jgi:hypothetical protein
VAAIEMRSDDLDRALLYRGLLEPTQEIVEAAVSVRNDEMLTILAQLMSKDDKLKILLPAAVKANWVSKFDHVLDDLQDAPSATAALMQHVSFSWGKRIRPSMWAAIGRRLRSQLHDTCLEMLKVELAYYE